MECVLKKFGSYENFEEVTGGSILPKCQVWAAVRKYLQKEGCVGEVSVTLTATGVTDDVKQLLLSIQVSQKQLYSSNKDVCHRNKAQFIPCCTT